MVRDEVEKKVLDFVRKQYKYADINLNTDIRDDLGITGIEAVEFLTDFSEEFEVDMSNFDFSKHFEGEAHGLLLPLWLLQWIYYNVFKKGQEDDLVPITIGNLVESVRKKKWVLI